MSIMAIGVSARALAHAIRAAGLEPVAVDFFGDRDLAEVCEHRSLMALGLPYTVPNLIAAARRLGPVAGIIMAGGLENDPAAVAELAELGPVLGNSPAVLERVRNWDLLARTLTGSGFRVPEGLPPEAAAPPEGVWLQKPLRGGGGVGVRQVLQGAPCPPGCRLERFVPGPSGSALFLGDGRRARLLGISEQLAGMAVLSAPGFVYSGNILRNDVPPDRTIRLTELCDQLVAAFGLVGLNGVDFIWHDGEPVVLEVNPRWTAAAELWEWAAGESLVRLHMQAVRERTLPERLPALAGSFGKAILYGDRAGTWRFDGDWRAQGLRDVPPRGAAVAVGHPICTVLAAGENPDVVRTRLAAHAAEVRREWIG